MFIQAGTCNAGKFREAIQAHLIISNIALGAQVLTILLIVIARNGFGLRTSRRFSSPSSYANHCVWPMYACLMCHTWLYLRLLDVWKLSREWLDSTVDRIIAD
jgi:hypothetical protein